MRAMKTALPLLMVLLFSACGGGGGSESSAVTSSGSGGTPTPASHATLTWDGSPGVCLSCQESRRARFTHPPTTSGRGRRST